FRDPDEVFKEFFQNDPFADAFGPFGPSPFMNGGGHRNGHRNGQNGNAHYNAFSPFGFGNLQPSVEPFPDRFSAFTTFSSDDVFGLPTGGQNGHAAAAPKSNVKRTATSTKYVNGKKVETRK